MMKEQVFSQALLLAGELEETKLAMLKVLCAAAASSLELRLREGLKAEDCGENFVVAASLLALSALHRGQEETREEFKAGDLSVKQEQTVRETVAQSLEYQAMELIRPYLKDRVAFLGV